MDSIKIGFFDSPVHEATAAVVIRVLEAHGIDDIDLITGERAALCQGLEAGDFDLFITLWLPDVHPDLLQANPALKAIGALYQPALALALPKRFAGQVQSIDQLAEAKEINRKVQVSEIFYDAAGKIFTDYGLLDAGFELVSVSDEEAFAAYKQGMDMQNADLMLLSDPTILMDAEGYYQLSDPRNLMQGQRASIIVNTQQIDRLGADLVDELEGMVLGNQIVKYLEQAMRHDNMEADEAAEAWQRGKLVIRA